MGYVFIKFLSLSVRISISLEISRFGYITTDIIPILVYFVGTYNNNTR